MKVNSSVEVVIEMLNIDEIEGEEKAKRERARLKLNMTLQMTELFLFKFTPYIFKIDKYRFVIQMDQYKDEINNILVIDSVNDKRYMVLNKERLLSDILQAYRRLSFIESYQIVADSTLLMGEVEEDEE